MGCSHTFGTGHSLENTWSYKLNKEIGGVYFNFGIPGTIVDTSFRLIRNWYNRINIKNVFHVILRSNFILLRITSYHLLS